MPRRKQQGGKRPCHVAGQAGQGMLCPYPLFPMMPQTVLGSGCGATSEACRQEDKESSSSEDRKRDKHLHSGATWLVKLPKVRLQQLVEAVD